MDTVEMIIFVNKQGNKFIIECSDGNGYDFEDFEFAVEEDCQVDESLLEFDGWGIPTNLNVEKALRPLKFYKATWREVEINTPDCHEYFDVIVDFKEIDYLNE